MIAQEDSLPLDVVQYQKDSVSPRKVLAGLLVDVDDRYLSIKLSEADPRRIELDQVLSVTINSVPEVAVAEESAGEGNFVQAAEQWEKVIRGTRKLWLQRYAAIQRCHCQAAAGQQLSAVASFLALAKSDPKRIPWEAAPLQWSPVKPTVLVNQQIAAWLESKEPVQLLLAASLGLQNPDFAAASRQVMQKATGAADKDLAALAQAQLWRLENRVSENRLLEVQSAVEAMPEPIRAGGWLMLGRLKKNAGQDRLAVADFLRVATLYRQQHALVLSGLDQAYLTLAGMQDPQAKIVGDWLLRRFPESPAAMAIKEAAR